MQEGIEEEEGVDDSVLARAAIRDRLSVVNKTFT
jgi:hypothetical protein